MALPTLSIVIPTHDGRMHLEKCLPAVRRHAPPGTQVVLVDDASTDDTVAWLRHEHPWVELVTSPSNRGFCAAVNAGLHVAVGDVVELLNNDTEVQEGWANAALRHFDDLTVGSVAPLVMRMDDPTLVDSAGQEYFACGWAKNRGYGQPLTPELTRVGEIFGATGSSGFYRRELLTRTGGLWPLYGAYFEDTDLAFQYRWAGYRCVYEPASRVLHKGTATYGRQPERLTRLLSRNEELVFWTNLPTGQLLLASIPHLGFLAIRTLRQAMKGQLAPFLQGKLAFLRLCHDVLARRKLLRALAATAHGRPDLDVNQDLMVLRHGWAWLRHRRSA